VHNNNYSFEQTFSRLVRSTFRLIAILSAIVLAGCARQVYESAPIDPVDNQQQQFAMSPDNLEFGAFLQQNMPGIEFPISRWELSSLTLAALYFNPAVRVAHSELAIIDAELVIAGQKPNPTINLPLEYKTEPGGSPWLFGLIGDFVFERPAKRQAKIDIAQAKRHAKQMALFQQSWTLYSAIHQDFIHYFTHIETRKNLLNQKALLIEILGLLEQRIEFGQASEFELSRDRLDLQRIELMLANQGFNINDSFHLLFSHTGLLAHKTVNSDFDFNELEKHLLTKDEYITDLNQSLLFERFDFKTMLAEYQVFENELKLEIEKQYPEINLSPGFIYEQGNNIWQLGAAWILPAFHNNEGQIKRALAKRETKQLEILQYQNQLMQQFERRKQNYQDKLSAYNKSIELIKTQRQRFIEIEKQYELGYRDRLSVIRAKLEVEKTKEAIFGMSIAVMQSAVVLEDVMQAPLNTNIKLQQWVNSLIENH